MTNLQFKPAPRQLYQVQASQPQVQQSHPRISLIRVLWVKFLRWLDKATLHDMKKLVVRMAWMAALPIAVLEPRMVQAKGIEMLQWHNYAVPTIVGIGFVIWHSKRIYRFVRRAKVQQGRKENQHTAALHGVPPKELADFLLKHKAFKMKDALGELRLSQGQYARLGELLEEKGVLTRGEANARVLRPISAENLLWQLTDKFPLVWDEPNECWQERDGAYARWCMADDFKRRKLKEEAEKKERKVQRLDKKIEEQREQLAHTTPFAHVFQHSV